MPAKNEDLHGNVPDRAPVALLLIDVINDLEFEGGEGLLAQALPMAQRLATLKQRARVARVPAIYVNDNFGRWRSSFELVVRHCLEDGVRGEPIARLLQPSDDDYFVLKPKHSGFFSTVLDTLLEYLRSHTIVLTGLTGDNCVLFTASDAYLRDLHLLVPADCVASIRPEHNAAALGHMQRVLKADTRPSTELDLAALAARERP
jgi:nicotinamidase-related amidase